MGSQGNNTDVNARRVWIARVLVAVVFAMNVAAAVQFIVWPEAHAAAYQLDGAAGLAAIRSYGILFLMWNATYPPVIARPDRYRVLFGVVIAQQTIGLVGELLLVSSLGTGLEVLSAALVKFAAFDGAGLVLLVIAFAITRRQRP